MTLELGMVTIDCTDPQRLARFWTKALDLEVGWDAGEFVFLQSRKPGATALGLQQVPESRQGKNRVHVDLATEGRAAEVARVVALGATEVGEHSAPGLDWTVLTDPEGNEFCIGSAH